MRAIRRLNGYCWLGRVLEVRIDRIGGAGGAGVGNLGMGAGGEWNGNAGERDGRGYGEREGRGYVESSRGERDENELGLPVGRTRGASVGFTARQFPGAGFGESSMRRGRGKKMQMRMSRIRCFRRALGRLVGLLLPPLSHLLLRRYCDEVKFKLRVKVKVKVKKSYIDLERSEEGGMGVLLLLPLPQRQGRGHTFPLNLGFQDSRDFRVYIILLHIHRHLLRQLLRRLRRLRGTPPIPTSTSIPIPIQTQVTRYSDNRYPNATKSGSGSITEAYFEDEHYLYYCSYRCYWNRRR